MSGRIVKSFQQFSARNIAINDSTDYALQMAPVLAEVTTLA